MILKECVGAFDVCPQGNLSLAAPCRHDHQTIIRRNPQINPHGFMPLTTRGFDDAPEPEYGMRRRRVYGSIAPAMGLRVPPSRCKGDQR